MELIMNEKYYKKRLYMDKKIKRGLEREQIIMDNDKERQSNPMIAIKELLQNKIILLY